MSAELSLVALALVGSAIAGSGSLVNWRGEGIEEGAGQKRTFTENLQAFFRLKDDADDGEDERETRRT